jgi:hypothetical protein
MTSISLNTKQDWLIPGILISLMVIISGLSFYVGIEGLNGIIILGMIISSLVLILVLKIEKFWIYSLFALAPVYFYGTKPGISPNDIFMSVYMTSFLFFWFINTIIIKKEKIIHSTADWLLIFFYLLSLLSMVISLLNDITFIDWAREFSLYSVCLLYFPLKYYIKEKKEIQLLLIIFAISIFLSDFYQVYMYKQTALQDVLYAYQLGNSVRLNQAIFTSAAFMGFIFAIFAKTLLNKLMLFIFSFMTTIALVTSFSRTFWIIIALEIFLSFLILPMKKKREIITMAIVVSTLFISISFLVFKENSQIFLKVAENRLTSSSKGTKDESVQARFVEYESAFKEIKKYPIAGNGLGARLNIYDYFTLKTAKQGNIHNAYIFIMHRWGIVIGLIFVSIIIINFFTSLNGLFKLKNEFYKIIAFGAVGGYMTLLISGFTTAMYFYRDSQFVLAMIFFFTHVINQQLKEERVKII